MQTIISSGNNSDSLINFLQYSHRSKRVFVLNHRGFVPACLILLNISLVVESDQSGLAVYKNKYRLMCAFTVMWRDYSTILHYYHYCIFVKALIVVLMPFLTSTCALKILFKLIYGTYIIYCMHSAISTEMLYSDLAVELGRVQRGYFNILIQSQPKVLEHLKLF